jgi:hypothetical protein
VFYCFELKVLQYGRNNSACNLVDENYPVCPVYSLTCVKKTVVSGSPLHLH